MRAVVGAVATALGVIWFGRKQTLIKERLYLTLVLIVIALIYVGFGLYDGNQKHLREEITGLALYGTVAALGHKGSIWWLVLGLAGHAAWDWAHMPNWLEGYTPSWYREYCAIVDLILAGYVALEQPT